MKAHPQNHFYVVFNPLDASSRQQMPDGGLAINDFLNILAVAPRTRISDQPEDQEKFMHNRIAKLSAFALSAAAAFGIMAYSTSQSFAQNPQLEQKLQEIKQASAANKQALARYTWQEQQTISLKGDVKKTQLFQVSIGPDGQQQKTELNASPAAAG